jgi:glycerol uptake facilitator-like aquaporin
VLLPAAAGRGGSGRRRKAGEFAGIAIGLTLVFAILMGGNATGASLNPARTLGPAVVTGTYTDIWFYFVGPILGGNLAGLLFMFYLKTDD